MANFLQFETVLPLIQSPEFIAAYKNYDYFILPTLYNSPNGIHGVNHVRRTLLLSLLMASFDKLSIRHTRILAYASVYHDIGRTHDGVDDYHGYASYQKALEQGLLDSQETSDVCLVKELIERHAISDPRAFSLETINEGMRKEVRFLLRYFKDADGLDRVRLGDLNVDYLRTGIARKMPLVAQKLLKFSGENTSDYFINQLGEKALKH